VTTERDQPGEGGRRTAGQLLAEWAARGAESGFKAVFASHGGEVFRLCCALAGVESGEELVRKVAARAAVELRDHKAPTNPRRWALRIAAEVAESELPAPAAPAARRVPVWKRTAGQAGGEPPLLERFEALERDERAGLVLHQVGGLDYGAVADILGLDRDEAPEVVARARGALQPDVPLESARCRDARRLLAHDQREPAAARRLDAHLGQCSQCPTVERDMGRLGSALDQALPKIAVAVLRAVINEASACAAEAPPSQEPARPGRTRGRAPRRPLALAAVAMLLVTAAALGLAASPLDKPAGVRTARPLWPTALVAEGQGIGGVSAEKRVAPCPAGTERVRDHCEPECPRGTVRERERCVPRDCPDGTRLADGECVPAVVCREGVLRDGRCLVGAECPGGTVLRAGRCERPAVCPRGTVEVSDGDCVRPARCPRGTRLVRGRCIPPVGPIRCRPGTTPISGGRCRGRVVCPPRTRLISGGRCRGRVVCPRGTKRDGLVCRAPVRCPEGTQPAGRVCERPARCPAEAVPVGDECVLPAVCPDKTVPSGGLCVLPFVCPDGSAPVNGRCELPFLCPEGTRPTADGCVGEVVCPPDTTPQGTRCVRTPCDGSLRPIADPCLEPPIHPDPPPDTWVDRHGDSHGRGHRPDGGRGHDPNHDAGPRDVGAPEGGAATTTPAPAGSGTSADGSESVDGARPRAPGGTPTGQPAGRAPATPGPPPAAPEAPPQAPAHGLDRGAYPPASGAGGDQAPPAHPARGHAYGHGRAGPRRPHPGVLLPVVMLLISGGALSRAGWRARPSR
jgi:DNA-directed RNA polymerase specialized sigma24 family protein